MQKRTKIIIEIIVALLIITGIWIYHSIPVVAPVSVMELPIRNATLPEVPMLAVYPYKIVPTDATSSRIYVLENGLTVYLSQYKYQPRIQTYILTKAGSKNDPADATGLAHYLEHMLFKGTDEFGTTDYAKEKGYLDQIENLYEAYRSTTDDAKRKIIYHQIDSISGLAAKISIANEYDKMMSALGAKGTNAYTSFEQTVYVNDIPSNQLERWLTIEGERFRDPVFRIFHTELEAVYEEKNIKGILIVLEKRNAIFTMTSITIIKLSFPLNFCTSPVKA
jgi:hypothetical protein